MIVRTWESVALCGMLVAILTVGLTESVRAQGVDSSAPRQLYLPTVRTVLPPPKLSAVLAVMAETGSGAHRSADLVTADGNVIGAVEDVFFTQDEIDRMSDAQREIIHATAPPPALPTGPSMPDQYGGHIDYYCDMGEGAFGSWYVSEGGSALLSDWFTRNWEDGKIEVTRRFKPTLAAGRWYAWVTPRPRHSILFTVWSYLYPSWFVEGSCAI